MKNENLLTVKVGKGSKVRRLEQAFRELMRSRKATAKEMTLAFGNFIYLQGYFDNVLKNVAKPRKDGGRTNWCIGYPPKTKAAKAGQ